MFYQRETNIFTPYPLLTFSKKDGYYFSKSYLKKKKEKVKRPRAIEKHISPTYDCIRFVDSYSYLSTRLDESVKTLDNNDFDSFEKEFPGKWECLNKRLAYQFESFKSIADYQKPVNKLKDENFFSTLKISFPSDEKLERTKEIINFFNNKKPGETTKLYLKCCYFIS